MKKPVTPIAQAIASATVTISLRRWGIGCSSEHSMVGDLAMRMRGLTKSAISAALLVLFPSEGLLAGTSQPAPSASEKARLEQLRKAADDLDEAADPAVYRMAWAGVLAHGATLYPPGHPALASIESELALADYLQGDVRGALARLQRLTPVLAAGGAEYAGEVDANMNMEVVALLSLGRFEDARMVGRKLLDRRLARFGDKPHIAVAAAHANYAHTEFEVGNYEAAIALSRRALAEARRLNPIPVNAAVYFSNLPLYLAASGRTEEAIEAARQTETQFAAMLPADHPYHISNLDNLARFQLQFGRARDAEATARRAVDLANAKYGARHQTASLMVIQAQTLLAQGYADGAHAIADRAATILATDLGTEADRTLLAREAVAAAAAATGDRARSLALLEEIAAIRARKLPPFHRERIGGADRRATLAFRIGDFGAAKEAQVSAQGLRTGRLPPDDLSSLVSEARLGAIEARGGDTGPGLIRVVQAAAGLDEQLRRANAANSRRSGRDREINLGFGWALDAALSAGDAPAAFRFAQRLTDGAAGRAARQAAARTAPTDPEAAALIRAHQDAAVELESLRDQQLRLAGRGVDEAALRSADAAYAKAVGRLADRTAALKKRLPDYVAAQESRPVSLAQVQAALGPDEALLTVAVGETRTAIIAVTRNAVVTHAADRDALQVGALVGRLRASTSPEAARTGAPFDFAASAELHATLLAPPISAAIAGKHRLLVVANGALAALPFAMLAPPMARPSLRQARWLIRDHALVTLPAVSGVLATRNQLPNRRVASFFAVGSPELAAPAAGSAASLQPVNMMRQLRDLPTLPATEPELRSLGTALAARRQRILVGRAATEASLGREDLSGFDVLAFATHGVIAGEIDGLDEAALVLTPSGDDDGLLTASEIMRLRLAADWIILSACNTAADDGPDSNGLAGLAQAFLYAGGRNLLASHWAVRDDAAAYLSVQTLRRYGRGADPAEALRRSMLRMVDARPIAGADHPAHWAPFVFIGR